MGSLLGLVRRGCMPAFLLAFLLLAMPGRAAPVSGLSTPVFINEIHYDNDGTDSGEGIELAGPAGTDLSGWQLVLYNGDSGAVYDTDDLGGILPDLQEGCGAVFFPYPVNGLQNGSPDGIALVDSGGGVAQFLSYEGSFTAVGGPADGLTSVDIGVAESGTTPVGYSLQLAGAGALYEDFTWSGPITATYNALNQGQTFTGCGGAAPVPELLLAELVATPTSAAFVELTNPGSSNVDLSQVYLSDATDAGNGHFYYNLVTGANAGGGSGGDFHARFPDGASIAPGEYQTVALGGSDAFFAAYGADPTYELFEDGAVADGVPDMREALPGSINDQGELSGDGEMLILYFWDGANDLVVDLDYLVWGDKAEAVDKSGVAVDGPDAGSDPSLYLNDTAISSQEVIDSVAHDAGKSWQRRDLDEGTENAGGGNGAGGHDETSENLGTTWCQDTPTPGTATLCLPSTPVLINEVDSDTAGTDALEFVELTDGGAGNTPLDGLVLVFFNGSSDASYEAFDLDGFTTRGDGTFLLGNAAVLPAPDIVFADNTLQNGADAVALYWGDAADFPDDTPVTLDNLVDAIVYDTDDADDAGLLLLLNSGQPQVNEDGNNNKDLESNQRCPDGYGGARNTDSYLQAAPTPAAENNCPIFIDYSFRMDDGSSGSGTFTLFLDLTFVDESGGTGVWRFMPAPPRLWLRYNAGFSCQALSFGRLDGNGNVRGQRRCRDGSGLAGIWHGARRD